MICIFYCLIWFLVRFMWLTVGYHVLCHIFGLDSFTVKNIHAVKKCFNGPEACFGLSAIHWWLGGGRTLRLVHWSGSEFSGKKKLRARTLWQTGKLGFNALSMSSKHIIPGKFSRWARLISCNLWHNGAVKSMNSFCVCMLNLSMFN